MRRQSGRRGGGRRKKKIRNLEKEGRIIDYKDSEFLSQFITERKKIMSRRGTGLNAKEQRRISTAIKRSRFMALLPYTVLHNSSGRGR